MELHPAIVHFPIALSLTAALLFVLSLILRHELLRAVALWNLDLAALAGIAAVLSGIWAEETAEAAGISPAALYLTLILLAAAMVGLNGYLGGKMVFEEGLGVHKFQVNISQPDEDTGKSGSFGEHGEILRDDSGAEDDH